MLIKFIGSGIPQAWIESGMYSATTVEKILSGKQMKRSIEAHTTTVLALCDIYIRKRIRDQKNKEEIILFMNKYETKYGFGRRHRIPACNRNR